MRAMMLFAVTVAVGFSQQPSHTLQFTQLQTAREFAEAATVIRSVGEIRNLTVDASKRSITLEGDPSQVALADWIFPKLDRIADSTSVPQAAELDYHPSPQADDIVHVFYFKNPAPVQQIQNISTVIRSLVEIRRAFVSNAAGAFVVRGTQEQMDAANWLLEAMDRPSFVDQTTDGRITDAAFGENTIHLFSVTRFTSEQEFQDFTSNLRTATQMRRVFTYYPLRVIAVRGTPAQIEHAARLIGNP